MEDMELLIRAKTYIDKLANGVNPITDEYVDESDVVNNVRISRCFFYVSDVLRRVIENGGSMKKPKSKREPFRISDEALNKYEYSDEPISITRVVRRINELINQNEMKRLSYRTVTQWLIKVGMLGYSNGQYGNAKISPTELGKEIGITIEKRISNSGEYYATYYNRMAQEFIINHIDAIVADEG